MEALNCIIRLKLANKIYDSSRLTEDGLENAKYMITQNVDYKNVDNILSLRHIDEITSAFAEFYTPFKIYLYTSPIIKKVIIYSHKKIVCTKNLTLC